jgi:hypothetical protein
MEEATFRLAYYRLYIVKTRIDGTTVIGLITNNDETTYREEVRDQTVWCKDINPSLNVIQTKEVIMDYRKRRAVYAPILINGDVVEKVESFKFLGIHITNMVQAHQDSCEEGATKPIPVWKLKRLSMGPQILKRFYSCLIESIRTGCITAWYGNCSASDHKALQRVVHTAQYITGAKLFAIQDLYTRSIRGKP